ncbi:hypothetical protein A9Q93_01105 [Nonlabens dokdonensis]|uniref:Uncharacterized protein n=1 Tax=Nonlabens dokdonensis TaxID=328515 RepID=A0A1Z8BFM6_9FLAO|nr:hypothetical protein A9Q93_01105 [Nonlabens dokdonensis]
MIYGNTKKDPPLNNRKDLDFLISDKEREKRELIDTIEKMFNLSSTVSKCIEIFVWMMWQENFILLWKVNENA